MKTRAHGIIVTLFVITVGLFVWSPNATALFDTDMPFGERVTDGRFPAVVRVWFQGHSGTTCSGVLITPRHVLTNAHCAPRHTGEIHDSAWYEHNGGHPDDAADDEPRFSFVGHPDQDSHPTYYPRQYWVHPWYDPALEELATSDLMVLVLEDPVEGVEPAPILGPIYREHLERGAWVRHVGFGPTEGGGAHTYKSTVVTRVTDLFLDVETILTWGEAEGGDSGSPVFQRRLDDDGEMREVLVGILMAGGIKSQIVTQGYSAWIQGIVMRSDPFLLPDDYDMDGLMNYVDRCLIKIDAGMSWTDADHDGVGDACDICLDSYDPGQFDSDGDGICNGSDTCPFGDSTLSFENVTIEGLADGWTRNPVSFAIQGVQSNGRWLDEEYTNHITVGSTTWDSNGLAPLLTLPEGEQRAWVQIEDGCESVSETREIDFGVDDTLPAIEITQPGDDWMVALDSFLTVQVSVEDALSGPNLVELWLGNPADEFTSRKLCEFPGPWLAGTLNTGSCTVPVDFPTGEHSLYAVAKDAAYNSSFDILSVVSYELTDSDHDGISDNIDPDPAYSDCFEHGATTGCITDRGDQELTITEHGDHVILQADCSGGELPAGITVPCNPVFDVEEIDACESLEVQCGSAIVRARTGSVVVRLEGIVVRLEGGAEMTATEGVGGVLLIENSGDQGVVSIEYGGQTHGLEPGQSFDLINVNLDLKPGSCPNPLSVKARGVVPYAVLGSQDLDVHTIDPVTLRVEGVAPLRWAVEDVAAPAGIINGKDDCVEDCTEDGADGYEDLTLKLDARELIQALGGIEDGDCLVVTITGNLKEEFGGTAVLGEDVVFIRKQRSE